MQFLSSSPNFGVPKILRQGQTRRLRYPILAAGAPPEGESWTLNDLRKDLVGKSPNGEQKE